MSEKPIHTLLVEDDPDAAYLICMALAEADRADQAALQEQLAQEQREFRAGRLASEKDQYRLAITAQVTQNWFSETLVSHDHNSGKIPNDR